MVMNDFDIHSEKDLEDAAEKIAEHLEDDLENCIYYNRSRKAAERLVRYAMNNIEVFDWPKNGKMMWLNDLTKDLRQVLSK